MKFNYEKLNNLCYDENNPIWYIKVKSYSLFDDYDKYTFFIDRSHIYNDSELYVNFDMFKILNCLNKGNKIDDTLSYIKLKSSLSPEEIIDKLLENNYIISSREVDIKKYLSRMNSTQLSDLLEKNGFRASFGKKKNLIKKCMDKIPQYAFDPSRFKITDDANKFLEDFDLLNYYYFLDDFDLMEYYNYVKDSKGDLIQSILNFLDEHIKVAQKEESFGHLDAAYATKSLIYEYKKDYDNSLNCELQRFILRANPQYYSYINYYYEYLIFDPLNIDHIEILMEELKIKNIRVLFNEAWDNLDLNRQYMSKDMTFDYLEKSLNGDDLDELSMEFKDEYLETPKELFNLSYDYYKNHDYLISSEFFDNVLDYDETNSEALYYESLSNFYYKDFKWAEIRIDEALEITKDDGRYWSVKGLLAYESKKLNMAKDYFKKALKLNPNDSDILTRIGVCYYRSHKVDDAIKYFDKALESSKNNPRPLFNKAKIHAKLNEWDKAEEFFDEAYNISGDNFDFFIEKGCYYLFKNQFEDAKQLFDNALKIKPNSLPVVVLKYLSLYELGYGDEYDLFKLNLSKLDSSYVEYMEKFLMK